MSQGKLEAEVVLSVLLVSQTVVMLSLCQDSVREGEGWG